MLGGLRFLRPSRCGGKGTRPCGKLQRSQLLDAVSELATFGNHNCIVYMHTYVMFFKDNLCTKDHGVDATKPAKAGVKVLHKSATMRHALKAQEAGVDIIEIVGYEGSIAGGQPGDEVGAWVLLAKATSTLRVPVVAAGASGTGRQLAAALAMGAQGVTMATRFLCTVEAPIDMKIKECMARPEVDERQTTIVLGTLSNATRVFKNGVAEEIRRIERQGDVDFSQVMPLASGGRTKKMWQETGDTQDAMWSCSQSLGVISDIPTCKELLRRMVAEAEERLNHGAKCIINSKL
ncbi:unnamed protein product [Durusdinium trenchii]|uniref:Nitronate monooxygenase domain-containing protein n=2 Tax=Durusdinium trenchii TaxID=1381693 RepID=A0ABP0K3R9_9DINO